MKTCGELIHEIRSSLNLSLRDFGKKCNLSHSYISKLEKGIDPSTGTPVNPSMDTIKQICEASNYPLGNFLCEIGYISSLNCLNDTNNADDNFQNTIKEYDKSIDFIALNYDSKNNLIKPSHTDEEEELLKDFKLLDKYEKRIIKGRIAEMLYNKEIEKNSSKGEFSVELVNTDFKDKVTK